MMSLFDVGFVFPCLCFVSVIQEALIRSAKIIKLHLLLAEGILIILKMIRQFLFVVSIICWMLCNLIQINFCTITKKFLFKCVLIVACIRLENVFVDRRSKKSLFKYYHCTENHNFFFQTS